MDGHTDRQTDEQVDWSDFIRHCSKTLNIQYIKVLVFVKN